MCVKSKILFIDIHLLLKVNAAIVSMGSSYAIENFPGAGKGVQFHPNDWQTRYTQVSAGIVSTRNPTK